MRMKAVRAHGATTVAGGAGGRRRAPALLTGLAVVLSVTSLPPGTAWAAPGMTTRVSVDSAGAQANSTSSQAAVSADDRYVAFASHAANLVAGDTNGAADVFVHDRETGATTRVSVGSGGTQANSSSGGPSISADGRVVAFSSFASNLVAGDTNGTTDVFVHDLDAQVTTRVSVGSAGQTDLGSSKAGISANGRYVAFVSASSDLVGGDTNGTSDVFVHDRVSGATTRVSVGISGEGDRASGIHPSGWRSAISADGRYVAFPSAASNLVAGDTNGTSDVFVHDRVSGATTRVSVDSSGGQATGHSAFSSISGDGNHVAFTSSASDLVAGDTNRRNDVFVHDRRSGVTTRVSVDSSGGQANNGSAFPRTSFDGRYVAFQTNASNLVPGDTNGDNDVFVHDRELATTTRVSVDSSGSGANSSSALPDISADGSHVAFESRAPNLVAGDTNDQSDIFVHELLTTSTPPADTTPPAAPTVVLTDPVNGTNRSAVTVWGTGEAGTTAHVIIDDQDPATTAVETTAPVSESGYSATVDLSSLSDGTLGCTVTLTDAAGNTSPAGTAMATKDTVAPSAPSVALTDPVTPRTESAATVSGAGEAGTTAHVSVDDEDISTAAVMAAVPVSTSGYSATLDLSSLSNGSLSATVTLTDTAGNLGAAATDAARKVGPPADRRPRLHRP